ncbi:MAG: NADH-quinone oxidoreductase subunit J [Cytophagales bacterium]|nr:NADH-quinone oxidoreductase subunit J [Cytophagales bacterium]
MEYIVFVIFAALIIISCAGLVFTRNLVHGALFFLCIMICTAVIFVYNQAEWTAASQLVVYAGGVVILIIFGAMLTANYTQIPKLSFTKSTVFASIVCVGVFSLLLFIFSKLSATLSGNVTQISQADIPYIGTSLMTRYVLPFEISGFLLLISLIGAMFVLSNNTRHI